ncbi:SAGA histone acetyltransferase complex subunit SPT7 NDAI_0A07620 [Naumovozyma dairenensis CBS 421]|uniref:SAGA complex subunit Spt7 n=1 Tax=Naumovozyma dairenensis (strain ATCC 10597 / BCRC 20456 / CBS 421 / NBRC 0211 / NRRL Y-12639) TaxID=1071378 RepID=G0W528_NAUDC|nr:hypothetical protein NDAI_0A07620 [Naumovozyma dairenensis CBS 421]CCD22916.1 hypothetical protein NDAI_0A07620 [Naumovozyma dairenensis CBS 421]
MKLEAKIPVVNYQRTNCSKLLKLTDKLFNDNVFEQYLTPQQLVVLEYILSLSDQEKKAQIWDALMNGNISLNVAISSFVTTPNNNDNENNNETLHTNTSSAAVSTPHTPASNNVSNNNEKLQNDQDELSKLDLEELKQHINGDQFIGNLSLKVRYVLWQCAIDATYDDPQDDDLPFEESRNPLDYVLLDMDSDNEEEKNNTSSQNITDFKRLQKEDEEEEDNYDIDEDEDEDGDEDGDKQLAEQSKGNKNINEDRENGLDVDLKINDNNQLILTLNISKSTLSKLRTSNIERIMNTWNKVYHNFEYDKETMLKRLKLQENDDLLESSKKKRSHEEIEDESNDLNNRGTNSEAITIKNENDGGDVTEKDNQYVDNKRPKQESVSLPVNLGIANLSLKHLLTSIQQNKSKLNISDYELKHLIVDVRKNRSKWTSDERIGQEELYEACEKVVLELRNYTEHSTPFLNKVSKREAPNYHLVIKKSMDLNTVLKKLKTFQYESKQEFVDDIMLIWKNCLTYNSDPSHFLRAHAIAMQKKSLNLIPMIPDITIRNRADVEKEIEGNEKDKDYEEEEEVAGSGRKGLNMGAHMLTKNNTQLPNGTETTMTNETEEETNDEQLPANSHLEKDISSTSSSKVEDKLNNKVDETRKEEDGVEEENENEAEEDEEDEDEDETDTHLYIAEKDDDRDDVELYTWKSSTATVRAEICLKRSEYFKDGKLNIDAGAFLKDSQKMKYFQQLFEEYKEQKRQEAYRQKLEQDSIMKNGFGTVIKQEHEENNMLDQQGQSNGSETKTLFEKGGTEIEMDNTMFLQEYDASNSIPEIGFKGISSEILNKQEDVAVKLLLTSDTRKESSLLANKDHGLTPKLNKNILLIQQIRHICHKISLIRLLQNPSFLQNSKNANANALLNSHQYKFSNIDNSVDLDPISQLPNHDYKTNKNVMWKVLHKNVSKLAMTNGFESSQPAALNMLTEIAGDYLSNLVKTIKIHHETNSLNTIKGSVNLQMSLLENGINRPDDLYTYIEREFHKKTKKLSDLKVKLEKFLKDLLRPSLQELSERNFEDESQSFLTGDFASELTGEDFFGFKELGLEKEFGVLTSSVPLQLLTSQFQTAGDVAKVQDKKIQEEELNGITYSRLTKSQLDNNSCWGTLMPLLKIAYSKSKNYSLKPTKINGNGEEPSNVDTDSGDYVILEDDDMILKTKLGTKVRLPPTGKISAIYRKRPVADAFFLPEDEGKTQEAQVTEDGEPPEEEENMMPSKPDLLQDSLMFGTPVQNGFGIEEEFSNFDNSSNSFSLSLPKLEH